jgi:peptidyl-prolyl cis-trans isomerase B (cyclophilin B)
VSLPPRHLLPVALLSVLAVTACGQIPASAPSGISSVASPAPAASGSSTPLAGGPGTCEYTPSGAAAKPAQAPPTTGVPTSGTVTYALTMSSGVIKITMDRSKAPCTVNSFIALADQGFYDKTNCHRLADSGIFLLQCGDPTGTGSGGPGYQYADETDGTEKYKAGVVAMANAGPDTNGSQFFLVWDDSRLPPDYTILGKMDKAGRDVVAGIASQGQDGTGGDGTGKPNAPAEIISAKKI